AWTWCVGRLLEGGRGARAAEAVRTLAMAAAVLIMPDWFGTALPAAASVAIALACAASTLVVARLPAAARGLAVE
ncbi:MAG: hypothetical protein JNM82_09250, partial [Rhodocyclaceae bacterium]|nr:hypothetical protein [Rhodocyclaceae bacterium]